MTIKPIFPIIMPSYSRESLAWFDAMAVKPGAYEKRVYDRMITRLIHAGVMPKLKTAYFFAAHDEDAGLLNFANPGTGNMASYGTITFTTFRGQQGDGSTGHLAASPTLLQSNLGLTTTNYASGGYVNAHPTPTTSSAAPLIGVNGNLRGAMLPYQYNTPARTTLWMDAGAIDQSAFELNEATHLGMLASEVNASAQFDTDCCFQNGVSLGTPTQVADAWSSLATSNITILKASSLYHPGQVAFAFWSENLGVAGHANLYSAVYEALSQFGAT